MAQTQTFIYDNLWYDCQGIDPDGNRDKGILDLSMSIHGQMLSTYIAADPLVFTMSIIGNWPVSQLITATPLTFTMSMVFSDTDLLIEKYKDNWIQWSGIGTFDFTIGSGNVAGEMPMDWNGVVWDIRKLGKRVMVYGENGVSILTPVGNFFGLQTIYTIGVMGKNAVCGNDFEHFFIDKIGQLWRMTEGLEKLDYSEYLSDLSSPIMSWDNEKNLIYICDGELGFVYSPDNRSMGKGPPNITGIHYKDGTSYTVSPDIIEIPYFELTTDTYDFGTRKEKTVFGIEVSTDLNGSLQASVEYRKNYREPFRDIGWHPVTHQGKAHMPCYGVEFRFKLRSLVYEYFEIDYFKINGVIHGFSHLDIQGRDRAY